uniref:Uncharacterized protein n=1 Tax=Anguilla anguilla TaxID=7936 RepID=A0A0E9QNM8_ANGAN
MQRLLGNISVYAIVQCQGSMSNVYLVLAVKTQGQVT